MRSVLKIFAIAIALAAGFFANDIIRIISQQTEDIDLTQYCMLSTQDCKQKNVTMVLSQDKAHPLVANRLTVSWPDSDAQQLELTLQGVEMDMGVVKFVLKQTASNQYSTDIILPVCTSDAMTWAGKLSDGKTTVLPAIRMER